jgi:hypothetical protein
MNKELKNIFQITVVLFVILALIVNLHAYLNTKGFIPEASRASQVINTNRLRDARRNKPSEYHGYPPLKRQKLLLIADSKLNKVFVIHNHRVIYILHAQIHTPKKQLTSQGKTGEQLTYISHSKAYAAQTWSEFGHHFYFVSPISVNQKNISNDWLKTSFSFPGSILLSQPDAHWLQSLPKGTRIIIR